jgi:predicted metal-dependent hydrolase
MERVNANPDPRARTRYMVSRLRTRITASIGTDRARYEQFSSRLEEITRRMHEDFERAAAPQQGARLISEWYTARGSRWAAARTAPLAERTGVSPGEVVVRDLGERWGACEPDGSIALHWALMQLPPSLVDLVLVHELTHLAVPAHGTAFRHRMRMVLVGLEGLERDFTRAEPTLWRGAV